MVRPSHHFPPNADEHASLGPAAIVHPSSRAPSLLDSARTPLAVATHVDWPVGRPSHHRLSLDSPYHWLLAIPTFALVAWGVARRWPASAASAGALNIAAGIVLGQILEPIGEVLVYGQSFARAWEAPRMALFGEFSAVGLLTYLVVMFFLGRSRAAHS